MLCGLPPIVIAWSESVNPVRTGAGQAPRSSGLVYGLHLSRLDENPGRAAHGPLVLASTTALLGQVDAREIIRNSVAADERNWRRARNYRFLQRVELRRLNAQGGLKSSEVKTYDITLQEGTPYSQLVQRDDRPLPATEERREQESFAKASPNDGKRPRRSERSACQLTSSARIGSVRPGENWRMRSTSGWPEKGDWMTPLHLPH